MLHPRTALVAIRVVTNVQAIQDVQRLFIACPLLDLPVRAHLAEPDPKQRTRGSATPQRDTHT